MLYTTKVAGVTFNNEDGSSRQEIIGRMRMDTPVRIIPEPLNQYDPNALAVFVAITPGHVEQIGYIPKDLSANIAPHLDGESIDVKVRDITGGFMTYSGNLASLGVVLTIDVRERMPGDHAAWLDES